MKFEQYGLDHPVNAAVCSSCGTIVFSRGWPNQPQPSYQVPSYPCPCGISSWTAIKVEDDDE